VRGFEYLINQSVNKGDNRMLSNYNEENLSSLIVSFKECRPFPKIEDRAGWGAVPADLKSEIIRKGEELLSCSWPSMPAVLYMEYSRRGSKKKNSERYAQRRKMLKDLVLAECVESKGRFLDDIINGVWCICEESSWTTPQHSREKNGIKEPLPDVMEPIPDILSSETAELLSYVYYLLRAKLDEVSTLICRRLQYEIRRRILKPYMERRDLYWMGFCGERKEVNNWNPWVNSNCLSAFLLVEDDEVARIKGIERIVASLNVFLRIYSKKHYRGGCDEGPYYWNRAAGSLFDCLELLHNASSGRINLFNEPVVQDMGKFIYRAHIHEKYYNNFGDSDARLEPPAEIIYSYGRFINDSLLMNLGKYIRNLGKEDKIWKVGFSMHRTLREVFNYGELCKEPGEAPYIRDLYLEDIEMMAAREKEGSTEGFYVAVKGGHNGESHNHNDVGRFIVYFNGEPLIIDPGTVDYNPTTQGGNRYSVWVMQSAYHNLPIIDGFQQKEGAKYKASDIKYFTDTRGAHMALNIAPVYPEEAGLLYWKRAISLIRTGEAFIEIKEEFNCGNSRKEIILPILLAQEPFLCGGGRVVLNKGQARKIVLDYDAEKLEVEGELLTMDDQRLINVWGEHLFRLIFKLKDCTGKDSLCFRIFRA
jgi:hypothetical protein